MSVEFMQWVCQDYVWITGLVSGREVRGLVSHPCPRTSFEPMKDRPALFKKFAQLGLCLDPLNLDAIRAFACEYGTLGRYARMTLTHTDGLPPWVGPEPVSQTIVETSDDWQNEARIMAAAVELYDAIRSQNKAKLEEAITLEGSASLLYKIECGGSSESSCVDLHRASNSYLRPAYEQRDIATLARACLAQVVNGHLDDTSASFEGTLNVIEIRKGNTRAGIVCRADGGLELHTIPTSLLGALWMQFALVVTGQREFKTCPNCLSDFEVGWEKEGERETKKRSAKYCSQGCHDAYHNRRKKNPAHAPEK